ncbi:hypothetical protein Dimus_019529 [Dionaea muscipula]
MGKEKDQGSTKNKDSSSNGENKNDKKKDSISSNNVEEKSMTVVLKVDFHCQGCIHRIKKAIRNFNGVDMVKEGDNNKLTVVGVGVDPVKLRDMVEKKMKRKVELISPPPKKEKNGGDGGDKKAEQKKDVVDNKKANKEPPVTTAVLKVAYHCHGCGQKIHKMVSTYKGVHRVAIDKDKDLVTVMGTMDSKALVELLKEKLRRPVEIVPPEKKNKDNEGGGGGGKKNKKGDGGGEKEGGGNKQGKNEGGNINGNGNGNNRVEYYVTGSGYECRDASSGYVVDILHAPQWFSEENANGCIIM